MRQPRAPVPAVDLPPVGEAGGGGSDRAGRSRRKRDVGRMGGAPVARDAERTGHVEAEGKRPAADRKRGQRGMQRVSEPDAVQRVLHRACRPPAQLQDGRDGVGELEGRRVERVGAFERLGEAVDRPAHR
jgi:hypothetical protein